MVTKILKLSDIKAADYNSRKNLKPDDEEYKSLKRRITIAEFIRNNQNNLTSETSPMQGYGNILLPCGVDENGDVIYKYNGSGNKCLEKQNALADAEVARD